MSKQDDVNKEIRNYANIMNAVMTTTKVHGFDYAVGNVSSAYIFITNDHSWFEYMAFVRKAFSVPKNAKFVRVIYSKDALIVKNTDVFTVFPPPGINRNEFFFSHDLARGCIPFFWFKFSTDPFNIPIPKKRNKRN